MPPKHRNSRGKMLQGAAAARAAAPSPKKSKTQLSSVGPSPRVRFNWLRWARAQCEDNKPVEELLKTASTLALLDRNDLTNDNWRPVLAIYQKSTSNYFLRDMSGQPVDEPEHGVTKGMTSASNDDRLEDEIFYGYYRLPTYNDIQEDRELPSVRDELSASPYSIAAAAIAAVPMVVTPQSSSQPQDPPPLQDPTRQDPPQQDPPSLQ